MNITKFFEKNIKYNQLTTEQIDHWHKNGYLILENFFGKSELSKYDNELDYIIKNRKKMAGKITIDVLEGKLIGKRMRLSEAPEEAVTAAHKINDVFLRSKACRNLNLNERLRKILNELLQNEPLIINSLSFRKGSQQPYHFDTYYMPPPVLNMMAVSSICIENQSEKSGPITYYPGSQKIPPYIFSHGGIHAVKDEMSHATAYIQQKIKELGLQPEKFIGKAGDVFLWHAQLYHGGSPITDHSITRKTLVTHYWRKADVASPELQK